MTGLELTAARLRIGWTRAELARRLGKHSTHADMWEWGKRPIPDDVAKLVRKVEAAVCRLLPPIRDGDATDRATVARVVREAAERGGRDE